MPTPYERYAAIYDRTGQDRFGASLARLTLARLGTWGIAPVSALDLATGTGAAAIELATAGIRVIGIDRSRDMLDRGRAKAEAAHLTIDWRLGDMRSFTLDEPVDLVVSYFDSINYLVTESELQSTFECVAGALNSNGWFVFDVNTLHRFESDWNGSNVVAYEDEQLVCLFRSSYDPKSHLSPLKLTVFERTLSDEATWRRWDEEHLERGYQINRIAALLDDANLNVVACYSLDEEAMNFNGAASDRSDRAVFFARRTAGNQ